MEAAINNHEQNVQQATVFDGFLKNARSRVAEELRELALSGKDVDEAVDYFRTCSLPEEAEERQIELTNRLADAFDAQTEARRLQVLSDPRAEGVKDAANIISKAVEATGGANELVRQEHDRLLSTFGNGLGRKIRKGNANKESALEYSNILAAHAQAAFGVVPAALDYRAAAANAMDHRNTRAKSITPAAKLMIAAVMATGIAASGGVVANATPDDTPKPAPETVNPLDPMQPANIVVLNTPEVKPAVDSTPDGQLNTAVTNVTPIPPPVPQTLPAATLEASHVVSIQQPNLGFTPVTGDIIPVTTPTTPDTTPILTNTPDISSGVTPTTTPSILDQTTSGGNLNMIFSVVPADQLNETAPPETSSQPSNPTSPVAPNIVPTSPEAPAAPSKISTITSIVNQPSAAPPESPLPGINIIDIPVAPPSQSTPSENVAPIVADPSGGDTNGIGVVTVGVVPTTPAEVMPTAPVAADPFTPPVDAPTPETPTLTPSAPTPKTPDKPAPAPEVSTTQGDFLNAAQNMIDANGEWTNRGIAMKFFIGKGLSPTAAAALVGNFMQEATPLIDPTIAQPNGPGRGIAQWSVGGRFDSDGLNLVSFAQSQGKPWTDYDTQLEFVWAELNSSSYRGILNQLQNVGRDRVLATQIVSSQYEGAGVPELQTRIAYTSKVADQFNGYYQGILDKRKPASEEPVPATPEKVGPVVYTDQMDPAFNDMKYKDGALVGLTACGAASLDMVANTIGSKPGHGQVVRTMFKDKSLPEGGTDQTKIMKEAPQFGLRTEYIEDYSIAAMKKVIDAGGLITFSGRTGTNLLILPGHFVVVYNINVTDGTMQVADPGNPANNGKWFSLQAELDGSARDIANGGTGLHYGFIAYYPTQSASGSVDEVLPSAATVSEQTAPSSDKKVTLDKFDVSSAEAKDTSVTDKKNEKVTTNSSETTTQLAQDGLLTVDHTTPAQETTANTSTEVTTTSSTDDGYDDLRNLAAKKLEAAKKAAELKKAALETKANLEQQVANETATTQSVQNTPQEVIVGTTPQ